MLWLTEIAGAHRKQRILFDVFENREMEFKTDEDSWPVECFIDKRYTAKKVIEEFMIIGNIESARFLVKHQPKNALVIHHPKPSKLSVKMFNEQFKDMEHKFKFNNVMNVQKQLLEVETMENVKEEVKKVCYYKARRSMEAAIYRRYSDVVDDWKKEKESNRKEGDTQELG